MSLSWPARAWAPALRGSPRSRVRLLGERTFLPFVLSVAAVNLTALAGNALAFRWVDPASMGVWHTLLLASSYLTVVRLGLVSGLGRELPYALGQGDTPHAGRIAATALAYNSACSVLVAACFLAALAAWWSEGPAWRLALAAMAVVSAATLHLSYLQATFRSDHDFAQLARIHWIQAAAGLLLPFAVYAWGFAGLCAHAAAQMLLVTGFAHAARPMRVRPGFDPRTARELLATGMPLFLASYLQTLAMGFDRVVLLQRGSVESVGYYAPALAVLAAMAIVPGAVSSYVYPRMSYALGRGGNRRTLRRMALGAAGASLAAGLPLAVLGWIAAPGLILGFFPRYAASIPAVRWSLLAGLLWSMAPASQLLGSLKAWRSLWVYIGSAAVARWAFPWFLSARLEPLEGVALGNLLAAACVGAVLLTLVWRATAYGPAEADA